MNRKSNNHEQESAARTVEVLERRPLSPTQDEQTAHELGQLLREASETDLPPSSDSMRSSLVEALDQDASLAVSLKDNGTDQSISHRSNPRRFWFVTAASGLLLLTGAVGYSLNSFNGEQSPIAAAPELSAPAKDNLDLLRDEPNNLKADLADDKTSKATSPEDLKEFQRIMQGKFSAIPMQEIEDATINVEPTASAGVPNDQKLEAIRPSNHSLTPDVANEFREDRFQEKAAVPSFHRYSTRQVEGKSGASQQGEQQGDGEAGPSQQSLQGQVAQDKFDSQSGGDQRRGSTVATEPRSEALAKLNDQLKDAKKESAVKSVELQERLNFAESQQREFRIPSGVKKGQSGKEQYFGDLAGDQGMGLDMEMGGLGGMAEASDAGGMMGGGGLGGGGGGLGGGNAKPLVDSSGSGGDTSNQRFSFYLGVDRGGSPAQNSPVSPSTNGKAKRTNATGHQVIVGGGYGIVGREPVESNSRYSYGELEELERTRDELHLIENRNGEGRRYRELTIAIEEKKRQLNRWKRLSGDEDRVSAGEQYLPIHENPFVTATGGEAISTFSIDVDTASYANMRRFLNSGQRPPRNSVRIEELVNYFNYNYAQPTSEHPFSVNTELADCPWKTGHKLLRVGLKGKDIHVKERPATNVVFLIDVSGSMNSSDKLPLLKSGFQMLARQLGENDRVSIVTYAGQAGVALEPTNGSQTQTIENAIQKLSPGGSTHGSAGIELAYQLAQKNFVHEGVNKVILATDGDLNVGVTGNNALVNLIKEKAAEGVFLTVLGFGTGNLKDGKLEQLADNGNGMYSYIDSTREAHRVLVDQLSGSLVTIAKDVKIQIEFNPAEVKSYRLLGYENRMLATKDFDDDRKDAGEIGAGHTVTAIYQIEPVDQNQSKASIPTGLKYQVNTKEDAIAPNPGDKSGLSEAAMSGEMATVALRYKQPDANESQRLEVAVKSDSKSFSAASNDFRFAASVAGFGMLLRGSKHRGTVNIESLLESASRSIGEDPSGYRAEFIDLIRKFQAAR